MGPRHVAANSDAACRVSTTRQNVQTRACPEGHLAGSPGLTRVSASTPGKIRLFQCCLSHPSGCEDPTGKQTNVSLKTFETTSRAHETLVSAPRRGANTVFGWFCSRGRRKMRANPGLLAQRASGAHDAPTRQSLRNVQTPAARLRRAAPRHVAA